MLSANGQALPYLGYVTMSINLPQNSPSTCLALVVPDHDGPGAVPLLLGTNILSSLLKASGSLPEFLQLVANCLKVRDSQLTATGGSIALIRIVGQENIIFRGQQIYCYSSAARQGIVLPQNTCPCRALPELCSS